MSSIRREKKTLRRGVNLVELLLVIIILGIIASIAVPRASRGSRIVNDPELMNCLVVLRSAVDSYSSEHEGRFPGTNPNRTAGDARLVVDQLMKFTSVTGEVSDIRNPAHPFGPYLHRGIPAVPIGENTGTWQIAIDIDNLMPKVDQSKPVGWIYNPLTGDIIANAEGKDGAGQLYSNY